MIVRLVVLLACRGKVADRQLEEFETEAKEWMLADSKKTFMISRSDAHGGQGIDNGAMHAVRFVF